MNQAVSPGGSFQAPQVSVQASSHPRGAETQQLSGQRSEGAACPGPALQARAPRLGRRPLRKPAFRVLRPFDLPEALSGKPSLVFSLSLQVILVVRWDCSLVLVSLQF